jgi:hypothetical protein
MIGRLCNDAGYGIARRLYSLSRSCRGGSSTRPLEVGSGIRAT